MPNVVYDNKVIESKATDLLMTAINHKTFMTIDEALQGHEGMLKTINTYTYYGSPEDLAQGQGNTTRGVVKYVGKDYRVQLEQQAFDYFDEEVMKDPQIVDIGVRGMVEEMTNSLTKKFYVALKEKINGIEIAPQMAMAGSKLTYEDMVDAIDKMRVEDESDLFVIIPLDWKKDIRKDPDFKACMLGEIIHTGQIGDISGIPVICTKALKDFGYLMTKKAVTMFIKKGVESEQDRNKDTRKNSIYLRDVYLCAITDATKIVKIGKAQAKDCTITTGTKATDDIAGVATTGAKVYVFVNGEPASADTPYVVAANNAYAFEADADLVAGDKIVAIAVLDGCVDSVSDEFVVAE